MTDRRLARLARLHWSHTHHLNPCSTAPARCLQCDVPYPCAAADKVLIEVYGVESEGFLRHLDLVAIQRFEDEQQAAGVPSRFANQVRWRYWSAGADVDINGQHYDIALGGTERPTTSLDGINGLIVVDSPLIPPAECWTVQRGHDHSHPVPQVGCSCGWRSLPTLPAAARYAIDHRPPAVVDGYVFTGVKVTGRALSGAFDDVDDTVRSAGLQIVGPIYLPRSLTEHADRFEARFAVEVIKATGDFEPWLAELAEFARGDRSAPSAGRICPQL